MKIKEYKGSACCGGKGETIFYKIEKAVDQNFANYFINLGLQQADHLKKAGVIYVYNGEYTLSAPIGSTKLQYKCKLKECIEIKNKVENILLNM